METKDIIILIAVFALAGFNIYRKYSKKNSKPAGAKPANELTSAGKDDDYVPYSGK